MIASEPVRKNDKRERNIRFVRQKQLAIDFLTIQFHRVLFRDHAVRIFRGERTRFRREQCHQEYKENKDLPEYFSIHFLRFLFCTDTFNTGFP